jgi:GAF domain-containing protein
LDDAHELLGVEVSVLQVIDPRDPSRLVTVAARGFEDLPPGAIDGSSVNVGLTGEALWHGRPVAVDDYQGYRNAHPQARVSGLTVAMAVPVRESGVIAGTLMVSSRERREPFSESEQETLEQVADRASVAITYARRLARPSLTAV